MVYQSHLSPLNLPTVAPKQLKNQWSISNHKVILLSRIYNRLYETRLSGVDNVMLLEVTKKSFCNKLNEVDFKLEYIWRSLRHQPQWCTRHNDDDSSIRAKDLAKLGRRL